MPSRLMHRGPQGRRPGPWRSWFLCLLWCLLWVVGCTSPKSRSCRDGRYCPPHTICLADGSCAAGPGECAYFPDGTLCAGSGRSICQDKDCRQSVCGDGFLDGVLEEQCDEGRQNSQSADATCRLNCTPGRCGDAVIDTGETCDEGKANSDVTPGAGCRAACVSRSCSDGIRDPQEGPYCLSGSASYPTGSEPYAVLLVDMDRDAVGDLVVSNRGSNDVSVLLGKPDGSFGLETRFFVRASPRGLAVADLNADGYPDIVVANEKDDSVSVLLGVGGAKFAADQRFAVGGEPYAVMVGDLDDDGFLEAFVANSATHDLSVLTGVATSLFGAETRYAVGQVPKFAALGDLDGDGTLDVVVSNSKSATVSILAGQPGGLLAEAKNFSAGLGPGSLVIANLTDDGYLDVAVSNNGARTVSVLIGAAGSLPTAVRTFPTEMFPLSLSAGDLDGDGRLDLLATDLGRRLVVLRNLGDGVFDEPVGYAGPELMTGLALGDVNGDGRPDVVATFNAENQVGVFLGGDGTVGNPFVYPVDPGPLAAALGDVNRDGLPDVVVASLTARVVTCLYGRGGGSLAGASELLSLLEPRDVALRDLDGDGRIDLIVANRDKARLGEDGELVVRFGNSPAPAFLSEPVRFLVEGSGRISRMALGDINLDGLVDVVSVSDDNGALSVLLGVREGTTFKFDSARKLASGTGGLEEVVLAPIDADEVPDLVLSTPGNGVIVLQGVGDGTFASALFQKEGLGRHLAVGDLDGDGRPEIVVAEPETDKVTVIANSRDGLLRAAEAIIVPDRPAGVAMADLNGDGWLDVVVVNQYSNDLGVHLGLGDGTLSGRQIFATVGSPHFVATGDVNLDQRPDVVVVSRSRDVAAIHLSRK